MGITRRDFLNGVAITIAAGLTPLHTLRAQPQLAQKTLYYPPLLTGMRGNHPGSFEEAHHLGRDNSSYNFNNLPVTEEYDLVVIGAGISGLSAAYFWQKLQGKSQRILLIDNHDDFGGHAKRNEFIIDKGIILGYGGSESLQSPHSNFSSVAATLLQDIGVNLTTLEQAFDKTFYPDLNLSRGVYFDKRNFGVNKVVSGCPDAIVSDDIPRDRLNGRSYEAFIGEFPLSENDRQALISLYCQEKDYLPEMNSDEKAHWLSTHSYSQFLREKVGLSELALRYFLQMPCDFFAADISAISCNDARVCNLPGFKGMQLAPLDPESQADLDDPYIFHFPDGNASLARLLVSYLIPAAAPDCRDMNDVVLAKFDYSQLDNSNWPVRLRLNSTGLHVANVNDKVEVCYSNNGKLVKVSAGHAIMAGYNMMIPYLVPEIAPNQQAALKQNVKAPLVYSNVIISNWLPFIKLGVHDIYSPTSYYSRVKLDYPVTMAGYQHPSEPQQPIALHMVSVPILPDSGLSTREQSIKGRAKLLGTSFARHEKMIREQLQGMLGGAGFDHQRDILAITVNRWSHGYSYAFNELFDNKEESEKIIELARQPIGHIAIANSDADWAPYVNAAIDQAWRAVNELINIKSVSRGQL